LILSVALATGSPCIGPRLSAAANEPEWLSDRGPGVRTSIFGTYVRPSELLVSPFFEYYIDDDYEYAPSDFGYSSGQDFRGRFRASERAERGTTPMKTGARRTALGGDRTQAPREEHTWQVIGSLEVAGLPSVSPFLEASWPS
jgi:hypothetical protein